jgi:hypothetical protein
MDKRKVTFHFLDGTHLTLEWPKQASPEVLNFKAEVRQAIASAQLAVEVEGNLVVIQMTSVKYIEIAPAPETLPSEVIRHARRLE